MTAPSTVNAAGYFLATRAGAAAGEATLRMKSATQGTLFLGVQNWNLTGDPATKKFRGTASGSVVEVKIINRSLLKGTVDSETLELAREVLRTIPAGEMAQSDPGPTGTMKTFMDATPDYKAAVGDSTTFWYAFGPVLYRGRLDGSARILCIASDPGPTERIAHRTLVGDAGQRVQGFLAKLGLTRSYLCVNAFPYALHPSWGQGADALLAEPTQAQWRNAFYDAVRPDHVQAVIA